MNTSTLSIKLKVDSLFASQGPKVGLLSITRRLTLEHGRIVRKAHVKRGWLVQTADGKVWHTWPWADGDWVGWMYVHTHSFDRLVRHMSA